MLTFEFKVKAKEHQYQAINEAIRTGQFIRNKALRYWMDASREEKVNYSKLCAIIPFLCVEFSFANNLNSMARQASVERTWFSISRFYANCKKKVKGKKGYPKFKKNSRSVEYKTSGWKLSKDRTSLTITDKTGIGSLKLIGTYDLHFYQISQIKRVRLIKRADGYYAQFCVEQDRVENTTPTGNVIGIDVGLESFYTDSNGVKVENPRYLRKAEKRLKKAQKVLSRRQKGSKRRDKAKKKVGKIHLKVSRQRKDFAIKQARTLCKSNDLIVLEDLNVKGLAKSRLAKSINDAAWGLFRQKLEYFGKVFNRKVIAINPNYTSQDCSSCDRRVKKSLSTRTHICECGYIADRDENAAKIILNKGLNTVGHTGIYASGQNHLCVINESLIHKWAE